MPTPRGHQPAELAPAHVTLVPLAVIAACVGGGAALLWSVRDELPTQIATHWDAAGRADGFSTLTEVLVTDEIGSDEDAEAVMLAAASGVAVLASAHARDERDAMRKPHLKKLAESGSFDKFLVLRREGEKARIRAARFQAP